MYQRIGPAAYKADLKNTLALCKHLDRPETKFKAIHVAGTNGKGSVSHMLAAILQEAGYKVGLYTSPHLKDFRERIRINGKMIPRKKVVDFVDENKKEFEKMDLSFFEFTVGMAFDYFAKEKVNLAVIEVGLGGRLDSTNVVEPILSVITNVSLDHTELLGNTVSKIANEKAGIIKQDGNVVIGEMQKESYPVFISMAKKQKAKLRLAIELCQVTTLSVRKNDFKTKMQVNFSEEKNSIKTYVCDLNGKYQEKNLQTVLASIQVLKQEQNLFIPESSIKSGLENSCELTGLKGRWQMLSSKPMCIADTAHNEAGIREVISQSKAIPHSTLRIVFGCVNDKNIDNILGLLPKKASYYFCKANISRALDTRLLEEKAKSYGLNGTSFINVASAYKAAKKASDASDLILITGSTFVVAEVI